MAREVAHFKGTVPVPSLMSAQVDNDDCGFVTLRNYREGTLETTIDEQSESPVVTPGGRLDRLSPQCISIPHQAIHSSEDTIVVASEGPTSGAFFLVF